MPKANSGNDKADHPRRNGSSNHAVAEAPKAVTATSAAEDALEAQRLWISKAAAVLQLAANGHLEKRLSGINVDGDLGRLLHGVNDLLDIVDAFVRESAACLEHAAEGKYYRRCLTRGMPGSFRQAAKVINQATGKMEEQSKALQLAEQRRLAMADGFETTVSGVVSTVSASAESMRQTALAMVNMAKITTEQAETVAAAAQLSSRSVQMVASATEELTSSFGEVELRTRNSSSLASLAVQEAEVSGRVMVDLNNVSGKVGGVVRMISQIANQTNMLALNANIEAARAGAAGRGFAVVANEVRNLSRQTASASEEIGENIEKVKLVSSQASDSIEAITQRVSQMQEISTTIIESVSEQRKATLQISENVQQAAAVATDLSESVKGVESSAKQTSEAASSLMEGADLLAAEASKLRVTANALLRELKG